MRSGCFVLPLERTHLRKGYPSFEDGLSELQRLLDAFREKKLELDRNQTTEYQVGLRSIGNSLGEAILEIDEEDKELMDRAKGMRKLHEELSAGPLRVSTTPVAYPVVAGPNSCPIETSSPCRYGIATVATQDFD
jgi:hypothetical protein